MNSTSSVLIMLSFYYSLLSIKGSGLSEAERDQIDNDAQEIMKTCKQTIVMFRVEADRQKSLPQVKEHRNAVMILIEAYLKGKVFPLSIRIL